MSRQYNLIGQISQAIKEGKAPKEFRVNHFKCLEKSPVFLSKHADTNTGNYTVYFIKISRGLYKLKE